MNRGGHLRSAAVALPLYFLLSDGHDGRLVPFGGVSADWASLQYPHPSFFSLSRLNVLLGDMELWRLLWPSDGLNGPLPARRRRHPLFPFLFSLSLPLFSSPSSGVLIRKAELSWFAAGMAWNALNQDGSTMLFLANTFDELPERLIGAVRVSHVELSSAVVPMLESSPSEDETTA